MEKNEDITKREIPVEHSDLDGLLSTLAQTSIARALVGTVAALVAGMVALWALDAWDWAKVMVGLCVILNWLPLAFGRSVNSLTYAIAECQALLERFAKRDLNNSGQVGDVVVKTEHHFVSTNKPLDVIPVDLDGERVDIAKADVVTVLQDGILIRERWLGKQDKAPLPPFADKQDPRRYYDACMAFLDKMGMTKRGQGNARVLVHSGQETIAALHLG